MWELDYKESWVSKDWCFSTVVLEKTLESPLNCKEIQPVHPKEISPEYSLVGLKLKLKLQYFGHLIWRTDSFVKTLILGKTEGGKRRDDRGWDGSMASPTQWTWVWVNSRSWWWTGKPGVLQCMGLKGVRHDWATELNWTEMWLGRLLSNIVMNEHTYTWTIKKTKCQRIDAFQLWYWRRLLRVQV